MRASAIEVVQDRWDELPPLHQAFRHLAELLVLLPLSFGDEVRPLAGLEEEYEEAEGSAVLPDPLKLRSRVPLPPPEDEEVVGLVPLLQDGGEDLVVCQIFDRFDEAVQVARFGYHPSGIDPYGYNTLFIPLSIIAGRVLPFSPPPAPPAPPGGGPGRRRSFSRSVS